MNCGKAAREGAPGCDLGTPFVNSSAPAEPQGRTHPPQWASREQPPQAALSESECSPTNRMILHCLGAHCAPLLRDNVANGNISLQTPVQVDFAIEHNLFFPSDWARACRNWLVQSPNRTVTRVPARPVVDSLSLRQSHKRRCPGIRPRHTACKFIYTDFTVGANAPTTVGVQQATAVGGS